LDIQQLVKVTTALRSFTVGLITRLDSQIQETEDECDTESEVERVDDGLCDTESEVEARVKRWSRDTESEAEEEDETGFHLVDRIVSHRGTPKKLDRMRFRVRWLNCTPRILKSHLKHTRTTCSFRHNAARRIFASIFRTCSHLCRKYYDAIFGILQRTSNYKKQNEEKHRVQALRCEATSAGSNVVV
jgi:hypothetical protein